MFKIFKRNQSTQNDAFENVSLGDKVKDTLTGFTGIVTARAEYLTGCNQIFVLPSAEKSNEYKDGHWFDIERIEKLEGSVVDISARRTGSDTPTPRADGART
ncbi:MAG: hypothetical protein ACSHX3_15895 [Litorimonas sp.]